MATNPIISYTSIDFDTVKQDLLDYISTIGNFTDYNVKGSNLNTLVQIVSYINTILAYNLNQAVNEGWLSTASLRENVLKAVKILNYIPARAISAQVEVVLSAMTTLGGPPVNLLKYDKIKTGSLKFYYTGNNIEKTGSTITAMFHEGTLLTNESAYTGLANNFESFVIEDVTVGDFLEIYSITGGTGGTRTYWKAFEPGTIYATPATEMLYFIEEVKNGYKISFGNNQLGRTPNLGEIIGYDYIKPTVAVDTNKLVTFTWEGNGYLENINVGYADGHITKATVSLASGWENGSIGATVKETIEEIKFNAPKFFQSQGRAVTEADYLAIAVKHPYIENAIVFGGDKLTPKELGKVYIVAKPDPNNYPYTTFTSITLAELKDYFLNYSVVTINPVVQNPQYVYLEYDITLRYTSVSKSPSIVNTRDAILNFINVSNDAFGTYLEFSKLKKIIDEADSITTSNLTAQRIYLYLFSDYYDKTNTYLRFKSPQRLINTTLTGSTKKTYIKQVAVATGGSNATYYEDTDYVITYDTTNSYIRIDFHTPTGSFIPNFNLNDYKLYVYSQDDDVFLSSMQLFQTVSSEINIVTEQV